LVTEEHRVDSAGGTGCDPFSRKAVKTAHLRIPTVLERLTMDQDIRRRFWFEAASSSAGAVLLGATLAWPDWVERAFDIAPDGGSGLLEWLVVIVLVIVILGGSAMARREWRRSFTPPAPAPPALKSSGQA
jgi:hypothetical protein